MFSCTPGIVSAAVAGWGLDWDSGENMCGGVSDAVVAVAGLGKAVAKRRGKAAVWPTRSLTFSHLLSLGGGLIGCVAAGGPVPLFSLFSGLLSHCICGGSLSEVVSLPKPLPPQERRKAA